MTSPPGYLEQSVGEFLDGLACSAPAPAGGSAAALAVAMGAALCAKSARLSGRQLTDPRAAELAAEAGEVRAAAAALMDADALAYQEVIAAIRLPGGAAAGSPGAPSGASPGEAAAGSRRRAERPADALSRAADVPLRVAELAGQVAEVAVVLAAEGNPRLRGDALTALSLARCGAAAAAELVAINLADAPGDDRPARAASLLGGIERLATDQPPGDAR